MAHGVEVLDDLLAATLGAVAGTTQIEKAPERGFLSLRRACHGGKHMLELWTRNLGGVD
jgi:hypothetical protein